MAEEITVLAGLTIEEQIAALHAWQADSNNKEAVIKINNKLYTIAIEVFRLIETLTEDTNKIGSFKKNK